MNVKFSKQLITFDYYVSQHATHTVHMHCYDEISTQNFTDKLKNVHIYHQLLEMNEANLEEKYEKLAAILKCAKDKHMPKQIVKYNKKKHKKIKMDDPSNFEFNKHERCAV